MFQHFSTSYDDPYAATSFPPAGSSAAPPSTTPPFMASSSPSYSSSPFHSSYYYLHRSSSTHSLSIPNPIPDPTTTPPPFLSSQYHHSSPSSSCDFLDPHDEPVRRVFSTGDLQASGENYGQDGGAVIGRVGRYSAEERRERIERYRSKRNQRNFHKKITYACRKTLADSRPRIRGRFARNGEMEAEAGTETEAGAAESCSNCDGEWWRQMLGTTDEEEGCGHDEDILSSFVDVFSMNLLS